MARYIDADIVREKIEALYEHHLEMRNFSADGACADCLGFLDDAPTADVAPKSEVERWRRNLEAVLEERAEEKAELAREIFEEIEKTFIDSSTLPDCAMFVDIDKVAELKKKYTEGE